MLRVAIDMGVAKYPAGTNNAPILPTDPAALFRVKDAVERGRAAFYADFPDATFRRRVLEITVDADATPYQVPGEPSQYLLPNDWMGPPQGHLVISGLRGGDIMLTSADRVRLAHAQAISGVTGFPTLASCEIESEPQLGELARWKLQVFPEPDQEYTATLRGRWRAAPIDDILQVEPTGHAEAIAAYASLYLVEKGLITTGPVVNSAETTVSKWKERVAREEDKSSPRTLGRQQPARKRSDRYGFQIRATNPYA